MSKYISTIITLFILLSTSVFAAEAPTGISVCESSISHVMLKSKKDQDGPYARFDKAMDSACKSDIHEYYRENSLQEAFIALQIAYQGRKVELSETQKEYLSYLLPFGHKKMADAARKMYNL